MPFSIKNSVSSSCWRVPILKRCLLFWTNIFRRETLTSQSIKGKQIFPPLFFSFFPYLFFFFFNLKPKTFLTNQTIGVKRGLRSSSAKFAESSSLKGKILLLGGDENLSIEEQWIIPPFFEDYLFDKSLDWDSTLCSEYHSYIVCREPNDLLTMDLELKHIPRLGTCKGDCAPTIDVVFKSHTSISRGWKSWCQRVFAYPPLMDIL